MKKLLFSVFMLFVGLTSRAQMIAVGTDVTSDLLMVPSAGVEMVCGNSSTMGLNVFGCYRPWGNDMKMVGVQPEYRHYFSGRPMHKTFVGLGALATLYDITWKSKVYDGGAIGFGLTFGYVLNLTKRLNVDFHAGLGLVAYKHKEYFEGDRYDDDYSVGGELNTNAKGLWLLPTRIGVSLTYILK